MGQQVNNRCKQDAKVTQSQKSDKYLILDPKPSDLTTIRIIKVRTGKLQDWALVKARVEVNLLL